MKFQQQKEQHNKISATRSYCLALLLRCAASFSPNFQISRQISAECVGSPSYIVVIRLFFLCCVRCTIFLVEILFPLFMRFLRCCLNEFYILYATITREECNRSSNWYKKKQQWQNKQCEHSFDLSRDRWANKRRRKKIIQRKILV